jgi:hypothetical protein
VAPNRAGIASVTVSMASHLTEKWSRRREIPRRISFGVLHIERAQTGGAKRHAGIAEFGARRTFPAGTRPSKKLERAPFSLRRDENFTSRLHPVGF